MQLEISFEKVDYFVWEIDVRRFDVAVRHKDLMGRVYGSLEALARVEPFVFAMNAGMYHPDMQPVGLYVEEGVETTPVNYEDGVGNFFLKPNGVFHVDRDGTVGVSETSRFIALNPVVQQATQSGPLLVFDDTIHPRFEPNGTSRHIRNGVGVRDRDTAVFAISRSPVSLGSFARLFRERLSCPNALFFDGSISAAHDGDRYLVGGGDPVGPIVLIREKSQ